MQTPSTTTLTVIALLPLIGWRMYVRVRRMLVRQRLSRTRPWVTLLVFPLLLSLLAASAFVEPQPHPESLAWLVAGVLAGALLAIVGQRRTRFEAPPEGLFYKPDARLGMALSGLFIARLVWRLAELLFNGPVTPEHANDFAMSPFTLGPVGLFAGYYMAYAAGLIRWRWRYLRARRAGASAAP
jgi:hypothetical protein